MKNSKFGCVALCAACLLAAAQTQLVRAADTPEPTTPDPSTPSSAPSTFPGDNSPSSTVNDPSTRDQGIPSRVSPTGRMAQTEVRGSTLMGSQVQSSSGESLGTISDVLIQPASGRLDFAVISMSGSSATSSATTPDTSGISGTTGNAASPGTSSTSTSSGATAGKLVAVPWHMLRANSSGYSPTGSPTGTSGSSSISSMGRQTFTFTGDKSKFQNAPSFESSNWPDLSDPTWRQSVYTHWGLGSASPSGSPYSNPNSPDRPR